jgi:hypothetical protein
VRESIDTALAWQPINSAIEDLARATGIEREAAWETIKEAISLGTLPAQCFDDRGERTPLEPHWIALMIPFQLPGDPRVADLPIGALPDLLQHTDFSEAGILWFDRRRAAENRLARNITADNRPERSLPPMRVRGVVVDRAAIERLIVVLWPRQPQPSRGSVRAGSSPTPHRFDNPAWGLGPLQALLVSELLICHCVYFPIPQCIVLFAAIFGGFNGQEDRRIARRGRRDCNDGVCASGHRAWLHAFDGAGSVVLRRPARADP